MTLSLASVKSIAFVMSPRLGDALLAMIIVNNLQLNGYKVTIFSNYLTGLQRWFPGMQIKPYPDESQCQAVLQPFDLLLHSYPRDVLYQANSWHPRVVILDHFPLYRRQISMVEIQVAVCKELLKLPLVVRENGLNAPPGLQFRKNSQRIIIHPTASEFAKYWLLERFCTMARRLQAEGYDPEFVVAPSEKPQVSMLENQGFLVTAQPSLDTLAQYIYESAWFIGNDSGIGHLASNLGIPTVSLMQRRKIMQRWRPDWAPGEAVLPWMPLLLRPLKERAWKYFISVNQVLRAFRRLKVSVAEELNSLSHKRGSAVLTPFEKGGRRP
ncbi:MAG TPA: glycosyltransferase family 9 protein [Gammaproteobacteria bacterium]|nr:glycosyltransferase family 9 protein [Gammaproteobacteria bacterium]